MNPETPDLLAQLRDIHAAPPPEWWPPAPGWWVLALLTLVLLAWLARRMLGFAAARRRRRRLLGRLEDISRRHDPQEQPQAWLAQVNQLLKVVSLRAFPADSCAGLEGEAWVRFLRERGGPDVDDLSVLARGPYQPEPEFDPAAVRRAARQWIGAHG